MTLLFQKYKRDLIGITLGAVAGFLYWKFIGCSSGTCMITSKPINSTLYGAVMGYLVAGIFKKEK
jgi:F0F1-type ATP synthase assembly protein I